jgi:hypothetical protein
VPTGSRLGDNRELRRVGLWLMACVAGALAGCSTPPVAADPDVQAQLDLAIAAAPYPLRLPAHLPDGFVLANVDWMDEPNDPDGHGFSFDVRYQGRDGDVVHSFQTNVSPANMGDTDPVTLPDGERMTIDGSEWTAVTLPNGDGTFNTQIARRFPGAAPGELVTLSIDGPSVELVTLVATALVEVTPPPAP